MPLIKPNGANTAELAALVSEAPVAQPTVVQVALSKDERISRAGVWQACVQSPYLASIAASLEDYRRLVDEEMERGLRVISKEGLK